MQLSSLLILLICLISIIRLSISMVLTSTTTPNAPPDYDSGNDIIADHPPSTSDVFGPYNYQCRCEMPEGSDRCFEYDTRLLATSIDEALIQFPNMASPTHQDPLFQPVAEQSPRPVAAQSFQPAAASTKMATAQIAQSYALPSDGDGGCSSQQCQACKLQIVNQFIESGPSQTDNATLWDEKTSLEAKGLSPNCDGANQPIGTTMKVRRKTEQDIDNESNTRKVHKIIKILEGDNGNRKKNRQNKRDASDNNIDDVLGIATQLGCNYKKGTAVDGNSVYSGLCNLCWSWRKLPDSYFPNYINEIACDKADDGCISGFGDCNAVTRPLNVLRNIGSKDSPRWLQVTVNANIACECQVQLGTPLHLLISS